jgi:hypothetical protein
MIGRAEIKGGSGGGGGSGLGDRDIVIYLLPGVNGMGTVIESRCGGDETLDHIY